MSIGLAPAEERLQDSISIDQYDCWTSSLEQIRLAGEVYHIRKAAWFLYQGEPIPDYIFMRCLNKKCINPFHMEAATGLFKCGHMRAPSNTFPKYKKLGNVRVWCITCWDTRKCNTCGRHMGGKNLWTDCNGREYCSWCRDIAYITAKCKVHNHKTVNPIIYTPGMRVLRHCRQCYESTTCPKGHKIKGTNVKQVRQKRYCLICWTARFPGVCHKGHDLLDPEIGKVGPDGGHHCRICDKERKREIHAANREEMARIRRERWAALSDSAKEHERAKRRRARKGKQLAELRASAAS